MKIEGSFDPELAPRIEVAVPEGQTLGLVVDRGFNGELMLPRKLIRKLRWKFSMLTKAELADGSEVEVRIFKGRIIWFGKEREVQVAETQSDDGLLGTQMFSGCTFFADLEENKVIFEEKASS